jgi:lysine-N-methylase
VTDAEKLRIQGQGWENDADLADTPLLVREGWLAPRWRLSQHEGGCVFLSPEGRCRIHERFGSEAKPLACRIYPFVLVPVGDHWRVGLRYSCPSARQGEGKPIPEHLADLRQYAEGLEKQEKLDEQRPAAPVLQGQQRVGWPDLLRFADALQAVLQDRRHPVELRWRMALALGTLCRQATFEKVSGPRLEEFLELVSGSLATEVPADPARVPPPSKTGRLLFRQVSAIYLRRDTGPERGLAARGRLALVAAAWRFARGQGPLPALHSHIPAVTFDDLEKPTGLHPESAERLLERYYTVKLGSLQFCGPTNFQLPFWAGVESLALTLPIILWLSRAFADWPRDQAIAQAIGIVDHNFGFSPLLGGRRQRWWLSLLARWGDLEKLIAWYSR